MGIKENISEIRQKILETAEKAGRKAENIKIVAVSKTVAEEKILEAYQGGQKIFGENKVQEWAKKKENLPSDCEWHIIGRLQTNKIKYLDESVTMIHSLDRYNLLLKLDQEGKKRNIIWQTLVQVNVAGDEAKAGLEIAEVRDFMETAKGHSNINIRGLMTIGALNAGAEETRGFFRKLKEIRDDLIRQGVFSRDRFWDLSMGMSQDYLPAVAEGATIVRIGSSIFGQRN